MILDWLNSFLNEFYFLVAEMAPYLLLGFLFAGILKAFFPTDKITRFMGRNRLSSVINASLLGVPMPLCSCGVIPTGVSFLIMEQPRELQHHSLSQHPRQEWIQFLRPIACWDYQWRLSGQLLHFSPACLEVG